MLRRAASAALLAALAVPAAHAQTRTKADVERPRVDSVPIPPARTGGAEALGVGDAAASGIAASDTAVTARYREAARRIAAAAVRDSSAWHRLAEWTDTFGPRLSGSSNLERALDWLVAQMRRDGFDRVWTDPVMVPVWQRGQESATLTVPYEDPLPMLGLGGSVGTPPGGIEADVLVLYLIHISSPRD